MSPRILHRLVDIQLEDGLARVLDGHAQVEGLRPWRFVALIVDEYVQRHMPRGHGGFPERPL